LLPNRPAPTIGVGISIRQQILHQTTRSSGVFVAESTCAAYRAGISIRQQNLPPRGNSARTWLAAIGWRRAGGAIDCEESPAGARLQVGGADADGLQRTVAAARC